MTGPFFQLWRRVLVLVGRGRITAVNDAGDVQLAQARLSGSEVQDDMPRFGQYGLSCNPPAGTDCVAIFVGGDRTNGVIIATNNQTFRMKALESGEVALSDDKGQSVYLSATGIRIDGGGLPISVENAPAIGLWAGAAISLNAPSIILNGTTVFNGPIASGSAPGAGVGHLAGPVTVDNDVIAAGKSLSGHHHNVGSTPTSNPI